MAAELTQSTVLIVDDIPEAIKVARHILESQGYRVVAAKDADSALSVLDEQMADLILLDIMMPGMDGFELCERLKQSPDTQDIPIIFLTSKTDVKSLAHGFDLGAVDYILKPYKRVELIARVKNHLALKHAREELKQANMTKDTFFSIIAHDLRNPFTALRNFLSVFIRQFDSYDESERREFLSDIQTSANRINRLLENLLVWSRIQTKRVEYNPKPLNLGKSVRDTLSITEGHASQKNIAIKSTITNGYTVYADPDMLQTILRNLVSNAVKYTREGGSVTVSCEDSAATGMTTIAVSDTGRGIMPDDIPKLFRIDEHHTTTGTANEQGSGLGLILCKEFVGLHGGVISVESKPEQGSTFKFTMPSKT